MGDLRTKSFTLTGMESLQGVFAEHLGTAARSEVAAAEEMVIAAVFDLVDSALALAGDLDFRVALSRSDEPRVALWRYEPAAGWSCEIHRERAE